MLSQEGWRAVPSFDFAPPGLRSGRTASVPFTLSVAQRSRRAYPVPDTGAGGPPPGSPLTARQFCKNQESGEEGSGKSPLGRGGRRPGWVLGAPSRRNPPRRFAAPLQGGDGPAPVFAAIELSCTQRGLPQSPTPNPQPPTPLSLDTPQPPQYRSAEIGQPNTTV